MSENELNARASEAIFQGQKAPNPPSAGAVLPRSCWGSLQRSPGL